MSTETTEAEARRLRAATVIDSYRPVFDAPRSERFMVWLRNLWHWRTAWAVKYLSKQLQRDPGFRESWHANIAMPIYDQFSKSHIEHEQRRRFSNACADRLMKHLFNA